MKAKNIATKHHGLKEMSKDDIGGTAHFVEMQSIRQQFIDERAYEDQTLEENEITLGVLYKVLDVSKIR